MVVDDKEQPPVWHYTGAVNTTRKVPFPGPLHFFTLEAAMILDNSEFGMMITGQRTSRCYPPDQDRFESRKHRWNDDNGWPILIPIVGLIFGYVVFP